MIEQHACQGRETDEGSPSLTVLLLVTLLIQEFLLLGWDLSGEIHAEWAENLGAFFSQP